MTTIRVFPTFPIPGKIEIQFVTGFLGNSVRVFVTAAPQGSTFRQKLDEQAVSQIEVHTGDIDVSFFGIFEVGGVYTISVDEFTKGASTFGGAYEFSLESHQTETILGNTVATIFVGERLEQQVGSTDYGFSTLLVHVFNNTIRETTINDHGIKSPALINPTTDRAGTVSESTTVDVKVDALKDVTASNLLGNTAALIAEMKIDFVAHFADATIHNAADTNNNTEITDLPDDPATPRGYIKAAQVLTRRLNLHMTNDDGTAGVNHHVLPDHTNRIIAPVPGGENDMRSVWQTLADVFRAYEAHRQDTTSHSSADVTNVLTTTLGPLLDFNKQLFDELRPLTPAAPATRNPATVELIHSAGFKLPSESVSFSRTLLPKATSRK